MILVTTEQIEGKKIVEVKGLVKAGSIRARHLGKDITVGLRKIVGGELPEYTKMMAESREEALMRLVEEAEEMDANAVVGVRLVTSMVTTGASEIMAYGTAVVVK
ncbi:MAG: YbjQ family protein [Dehalococcoidia bacterium]|nr:YbjQ family protein [Dehalococcoidia bacterium]